MDCDYDFCLVGMAAILLSSTARSKYGALTFEYFSIAKVKNVYLFKGILQA
jgi:hypothetical protein